MRDGAGERGAGFNPVVQMRRRRRAAGMLAKRSASGQAAAKAMRTRFLVSVTLAAILRSLSRKVANSALALRNPLIFEHPYCERV